MKYLILKKFQHGQGFNNKGKESGISMKHYLGRCTDFKGADVIRLQKMIRDSKSLKRRSFKKHVDDEALFLVENKLGYSPTRAHGLTMAMDPHVSYHKSKFGDRECVFFRWSAFEYIFVEAGEARGNYGAT